MSKSIKKSKSKSKKNKTNRVSPHKIKKSESKPDQTKTKSSNKKNNNNKYQRQIILTRDLIVNNKSPNSRNKIKKENLFRKQNNTANQAKKNINIIQKKQRKSAFDLDKIKRFKIKDFEIINKNNIIKRNLSFQHNTKLETTKNSNDGEINILKLYEDDMDRIVNFINDEEKRRVKIEKNAERMAKEKKVDSEKSVLYSLFRVKEKKKVEEEEKEQDDLTREDIVEKLKRDDWRTRQYIEDIVRAGLTMGNKEINKQMKNKTIIIFQGLELGTFKFKRNFGIKEDMNIEPYRPKSHKETIKTKSEKKEKEKNILNKKEKEKKEKEKKKEEEKREKERLKKKKLEEAKKKLIYDNSYLFAKKKKSINFILRKEIEEIVHGGILIQQLANKEEEHNTEIKNRFLPPKRAKFVKKKRNRAKLFRKSKFLNDVMNTVVIPKQENNYSSSISEIKEESNHSFEDKMQTLIDRVKKLRKGEELNLNEIEKIMNQKNVRNKKEKEKEIRMQEFMNKLNEYRDMNKSTRKKYNNFAYKVPILIMANSEGD